MTEQVLTTGSIAVHHIEVGLCDEYLDRIIIAATQRKERLRAHTEEFFRQQDEAEDAGEVSVKRCTNRDHRHFPRHWHPDDEECDIEPQDFADSGVPEQEEWWRQHQHEYR